MSGEKWTPGPWIVDFDLCDEEGPLGVPEVNGRILDQDNCVVCQASTEANAFLIAAAPEMYAALYKTCHNALDLGHCHLSDCANCQNNIALKKARGEA